MNTAREASVGGNADREASSFRDGGRDAGDAGLERALARELRGVVRARSTLAVVDASSTMGRAAATALAADFERVILAGDPGSAPGLLEVTSELLDELWRLSTPGGTARGSLAGKLAELRTHLPPGASRPELMDRIWRSGILEGALVITTNLDAWLPAVDVLVSATSPTAPLLRFENVRPGAVLCDLSRRRGITDSTRRAAVAPRLVPTPVRR